MKFIGQSVHADLKRTNSSGGLTAVLPSWQSPSSSSSVVVVAAAGKAFEW